MWPHAALLLLLVDHWHKSSFNPQGLRDLGSVLDRVSGNKALPYAQHADFSNLGVMTVRCQQGLHFSALLLTIQVCLIPKTPGMTCQLPGLQGHIQAHPAPCKVSMGTRGGHWLVHAQPHVVSTPWMWESSYAHFSSTQSNWLSSFDIFYRTWKYSPWKYSQQELSHNL